VQSEQPYRLARTLGDPDPALPQNVIAKEPPRVVEGVLLVLAHIPIAHPIRQMPSGNDFVEVGLHEIANSRHAETAA
jgi:hypothetical protein